VAVSDDLASIVALMLEYRSQLPESFYPEPDPGHALANLLAWHEAGDLLYEVERRDGEPVGCAACLLLDAWWCADRRVANEIILYLRPQWRGAGIGWRMRLRLADRCRESGARSVETLHMNMTSIEADDMAYRRAGYRLTGWAYERAL
jgi:GNAT superfamily N-acetyltransferase